MIFMMLIPLRLFGQLQGNFYNGNEVDMRITNLETEDNRISTVLVQSGLSLVVVKTSTGILLTETTTKELPETVKMLNRIGYDTRHIGVYTS